MRNDTTNESEECIASAVKFEYTLRLFLYHADQRIKSFNFYILLLIATIGGTITIFEKLSDTPALFYAGILNLIIAITFWVVDIRSKHLVNISRKALLDFEESDRWGNYPTPMKNEGEKQIGLSRLISFTYAFRFTFLLHALIGCILCVIYLPVWLSSINKFTSWFH